MRALGFERFRQASVLAVLLLFPSGVQGQLRAVVSNEIAVSETEATLLLGFQEGRDLEISLREGQVRVDGESIGDFARRDALDLAWRALLGEVITLDDGPLAQRLNDWDPPENLSGESLALASRLDAALEEALALEESPQDTEVDLTTLTDADQESVVAALLTRSGALSRLAGALEGTALDRFTLKVGEDVVVEAGEEISGDLVIVDGDLVLQGTVDGNVILIGGAARLGDQGVITGDLRISDGTLVRAGGSVSGSLIQLDAGAEAGAVADEGDLEEMRRDLEAQIRRELRFERKESSRRSSPFFRFMGHVGSAIAGLLENIISFIVLSILGVLAVHFQRERMEIVATTARRAPVRSAVVGLAGGFFLLPIWILGIIALAITIIGIPVLLAWIPLFPIAAGLAILLGYLGVARNVGEWVAEQEYRGLEWIRGSNTFYTVVAGVGALVLPYMAVNVSRIIGFGFLTGLLGFAASMITFAVGAVGLGAVLLTRGGKIRPMESYYDFEEDYWADMDDRATGAPDPPHAEPHAGPDAGTEAASEAEPQATSDPGPDSEPGPAEPEEAEWSEEDEDHGDEEKEEDDANR